MLENQLQIYKKRKKLGIFKKEAFTILKIQERILAVFFLHWRLCRFEKERMNFVNTHTIAEFITLSDYRFVNIETFQVCKKTFCRSVKLEHSADLITLNTLLVNIKHPADLVTLNILQICKHTSCSFESIKHLADL